MLLESTREDYCRKMLKQIIADIEVLMNFGVISRSEGLKIKHQLEGAVIERFKELNKY